MTGNVIPDIVVSRLPRYLRSLQVMAEEGKKTTSSKELGQEMGFTAAQIRKDFSLFGEFGKQGTGYDIHYLITQLETILNIHPVWNIVLVGVGDLGHAIARYQGFSNRGFSIALIVDSDPEKIGEKIGEFVVQDSRKLESLIQESGIKIAMLTVPASVAQTMANQLVKVGVKAILNYAPVLLKLPPEIYVEYNDPIIQLQHMTYYLK